jgi:hypothetical protein
MISLTAVAVTTEPAPKEWLKRLVPLRPGAAAIARLPSAVSLDHSPVIGASCDAEGPTYR